MTEPDEKSMVNEERAKIFIDELSKDCPMLDYQKELLIKTIVNGCHNYLPYQLEMKRLGRLYYYPGYFKVFRLTNEEFTKIEGKINK